MNFFEYTIEVPINEETERRTEDIINMVKDGICCFNLNKIIDEKDEKDNNKRVFILIAHTNISPILYNLFNGLKAKFLCYNKTLVLM